MVVPQFRDRHNYPDLQYWSWFRGECAHFVQSALLSAASRNNVQTSQSEKPETNLVFWARDRLCRNSVQCATSHNPSSPIPHSHSTPTPYDKREGRSPLPHHGPPPDMDGPRCQPGRMAQAFGLGSAWQHGQAVERHHAAMGTGRGCGVRGLKSVSRFVPIGFAADWSGGWQMSEPFTAGTGAGLSFTLNAGKNGGRG